MDPGPVLANVDLRGSLVRLRRPRIEDAERTFKMIAGRREILDWIEWSGPRDIGELRDKARHWRTESDTAANYQLAIVRTDSGEVAGAMSLRFIDHPDSADLGYWIGVAHQGRGLASEAVGLAVWLAFDALEANSVTACVFLDNFASRRVLEKHGFELRATSGDEISCGRRPRWSFALERQTWLARAEVQRPLDFELAFTDARP